MATITISTRVSVPDETVATVIGSLKDAATAALNSAQMSGSLMTQVVSTDIETGERIKRSKLDYVDGPAAYDALDENEDLA
jgi:hypothetical protein